LEEVGVMVKVIMKVVVRVWVAVLEWVREAV
jgi:hypothetical protein